LGVTALVAASAFGTYLFAQTAAQLTPPTFRPDLPQVGGAIVFSGEPGLEAPPGAERFSVTISGVTIEGGLPAMAGAEQALEARLVGGPVPVSELFAAVQDLEEAYAQAGYVLARVVLPAQSLQDGDRLRIVVVNGYVERIDVEGVPEQVRDRIEKIVDPLVGERSMTLGEIERRLLLAGDTPGVGLRSTLAPGPTPGGTVLAIDGTFRPVTGFVGADNTLADDLGTWQMGVGADINNAFGLGEVIYLRASGHPSGDDSTGLGGYFTDNPRLRILAAGAIVPIGINGLTFNVEGTQSLETPEPSFGIQTSSEFERLSFRLRYPWIRSRAFNLGTEVIFDITSEDQKLLNPDFDLYQDDLRVLRLAADAVREFDSGAVVAGRAVLSFGLDAFGARTSEDATPNLPLSRAGVDADFQKLEVAASYARPVADHLSFSLFARGQTSFGQPLASSEQIGIASFQELSTFDAGTIGGDSGWIVRGDVQSPWNVAASRVPLLVVPYAFAATGTVYLEEPSVLENRSTRASSVGIGVELTAIREAGVSDASLTLEYGRGFRNDDFPDDNRFTVVGTFRF
jgi:hemolysin activation/secretion protein